MKTTITKAEAHEVLEAATKLVEALAAANGVAVDSQEGQVLYDKIVFGALNECMPNATIEQLFELLEKPDGGH
ncbi:hypothetical protein [Burkholderia vietnamiensis]|uniref:hypothetical protein n=1 Tax=Burkholderia vietnamiensis TaxID=60552 RepID=UPI00075AC4D9|nr:hypothetical protein [Burkholderia vietnamiensis]AOK40863.1 hypothetical protein WL96_07300 [Burkholderia vietnamiensis]KVE11201.1 hypothetical protein WI92_00765 [Burkholderia vietnamiensis]MCA8016747.1 hypothetical protein [Burkholderia vietnamiensis]MDN7412623.1 hypothetical protein [Burkholderia vietnamiensis]HDR9199334.1 hypothetical protein [Burkholderia vietnamiensis]